MPRNFGIFMLKIPYGTAAYKQLCNSQKRVEKKNEKNENNVLTFLCPCNIIIFASQGMTGCGSAWLERLVWDQEVAGSNPVTPISVCSAGVVQW